MHKILLVLLVCVVVLLHAASAGDPSPPEGEEPNERKRSIVRDMARAVDRLSGVVPLFAAQTRDFDHYDIVIEFESLLPLRGDGWRVWMREPHAQFANRKNVVVGFSGGFNKGKTFLLNALSKFNLLSGLTHRTPGIAVRFMQEETRNPVTFLDTAGLHTPVLHVGNQVYDEDERLVLNQDRVASEFLRQQFVWESVHILICVVNELTFSDQKLLERLISFKRERKHMKAVFLVHNFPHLREPEDVEVQVKGDVFGAFNKVKRTKSCLKQVVDGETCPPESIVTFFSSEHFIHLVTAAENSPAGDALNHRAIDFLRRHVMGFPQQFVEQFDVIQELSRFIDKRFKNFATVKGNPRLRLVDEGEERRLVLGPCQARRFLFRPLYFTAIGDITDEVDGFVAKIDRFEDDNGVTFYLDVPGLEADDVRVVAKTLTTETGSHLQAVQFSGERVTVKEDAIISVMKRPSGKFLKTVELAELIDPTFVEKSSSKGIVRVRLAWLNQSSDEHVDEDEFYHQ